MWPDREIVKTELGNLEKSGDGWMCYCDYDARDLEMSVDDCGGKPDQAQVAFLLSLLPKLSEYELECRRKIDALDEEHDFAGVFFKDGCECVLAFNWGDGEWGRTVFAKMTGGNVIDTYIVSD